MASETPPSALQDHSPITGEPCNAPCWYGLRPGVSTRDESLRVAQSLPFLAPEEPEVTHTGYWDIATQQYVPAIHVRYTCRHPLNATCAGLLFVGEVLTQIHLIPNYTVTLGELVGALGQPDFVQFIPHRELEAGQCEIGLVWQQLGVIARVRDPGTDVSLNRCPGAGGDEQVGEDLPANEISYLLQHDAALESVPEAGRDLPWVGFTRP